MSLVVITPTRGRPAQFAAMCDAAVGLAGTTVRVVAYVDEDDPQLELYRQVCASRAELLVGRPRQLAPASDYAAAWVLDPANGEPPVALASLGDDHFPRTYGWARSYVDELADLGGGIVYGDDLHRGEKLATQWAMSASIVRELGRMVPAPVQHLYADTSIMALGAATGCLRYLPGVVVEHAHYAAGKAKVDAVYRAANSPQRCREDKAAYEQWLADGLAQDAARVRALRNGGLS